MYIFLELLGSSEEFFLDEWGHPQRLRKRKELMRKKAESRMNRRA
jgi:hypothetical protein